jgi:hypothetical protein
VAVRPGDAVGVPTTSSLNVTSPGVVVPNSVTVGVPVTGPSAGAIELYFHGDPGATTHLLVDIVGYYLAGGAGGSGPQGPQGPAGPAGPPGADGDDLFQSVAVVNGNRTPIDNGSRLLHAVRDARGSSQNPWTIFVEPGVYDLRVGTVTLEPYVSIVGSGRGVTTLILDTFAGIEVSTGSTIADLTIENVQDSATTASKVLTLTRADGAVLRDLEIISQFDSGIQIGSSADVLLDGVEVDAGDLGIAVTSLSGIAPPSTVTIIGSTISSLRAGIWGLDDGNLVEVRDSRIESERDTINAYQGGKVVIEHSTVVASVGAWARINTAIDLQTVYVITHTHIETQQSFASAGLLTPPRCVAVTTSAGTGDTCP